jgi:hypothetical protein
MRTDVDATGQYLQPWILLLLTLEKRRYRTPH